MPNPLRLPLARPRIFYGWYIAWAYFFLNFFWSGTILAGFSALFTPIKETFGFSSSVTTAAVSMRQGASIIGSPLVGRYFDRAGARRLMVVATIFACGGTAILSYSQNTWQFFLSFAIASIGVAIFVAGTGPALMVNWFHRSRGKAMSVVMVGAGVAAFLLPVMVWLTDHYGWRDTLRIVVVGMAIIGFAVALITRQRPEDYGLLPDGARATTEAAASVRLEPVEGQSRVVAEATTSVRGEPVEPRTRMPTDATFRDVIRTRAFWLIAASYGFVAFGNSAAGLFFIPHLTNEGFSKAEAAWTATGMGIVGVLGTLIAGWLSDVVDRRRLIMLAYAMQGGGMAVFAFASSTWHLMIFAGLFGFGARASLPIVSSLLADRFGSTNFGQIQGLLFSVFTAGNVAGNQIAAAIRDHTGHFTSIFALYAILSLPAIAIMAWVPATASGAARATSEATAHQQQQHRPC
ncbi:MAG: MFS transporter [Chloroflexi bacterium]|nr:MFS transporter [Chloroflexota bacterium]